MLTPPEQRVRFRMAPTTSWADYGTVSITLAGARIRAPGPGEKRTERRWLERSLWGWTSEALLRDACFADLPRERVGG